MTAGKAIGGRMGLQPMSGRRYKVLGMLRPFQIQK